MAGRTRQRIACIFDPMRALARHALHLLLVVSLLLSGTHGLAHAFSAQRTSSAENAESASMPCHEGMRMDTGTEKPAAPMHADDDGCGERGCPPILCLDACMPAACLPRLADVPALPPPAGFVFLWRLPPPAERTPDVLLRPPAA